MIVNYRFSPENEGNYCKRAFQPFGVGPRCCVGYKLALFQVLYFTARMVQNFKMELGEANKVASVFDSKFSVLSQIIR